MSKKDQEEIADRLAGLRAKAKPKYQLTESLKFADDYRRIGAKTSTCLQMKDLFEVSVRGFTPAQWTHVTKCKDCIVAYGHYMKLRRAEARTKLGLDMTGVPLPDMDRLK